MNQLADVAKTRRLVAEILEAHDFTFELLDDSFHLRFASSRVQILVVEVGGQTLVELRSRVLRDIPDIQEQAPHILRKINSLNDRIRFCKWILIDSNHEIDLEYDLLGDHLQEEELVTALALLARLADREDDRLQELFGGRKAFE